MPIKVLSSSIEESRNKEGPNYFSASVGSSSLEKKDRDEAAGIKP